ncbi:MAG TPA: histidine triad nucleotide-binding protein [Bacillota bacterium]|nr:histidine triad nucleotide-binding protein [Bacillota bacterium]
MVWVGCIFCSIVARDIPAQVVYEDERVLAFRDINAVAPEHILVIPKQHIARLDEQGAEDCAKAVFSAIGHLVRTLDFADAGYRVVCNTGPDGGQTVAHLHFHVLGGRQMQWPPG